MAHMSKEIFVAGEYFRFHFSGTNSLGLITPGNESLNAAVYVSIDLIGLRYKLEVGARMNNKSRVKFVAS